MTTTLSCPKCGSQMRSYERNRVLVEQCTGCGGLFLDRGELEKLVAAETDWHAAPSPAPTPQGVASASQGHTSGYQQPRHRKRKTSFLSELFDD